MRTAVKQISEKGMFNKLFLQIPVYHLRETDNIYVYLPVIRLRLAQSCLPKREPKVATTVDF